MNRKEDKIRENSTVSENRKRLKSAFSKALTLCLLSLFLAGGFIAVVNDVYAFVKRDSVINVNIPAGSSLSEISALLGREGVIENPFVFSLYVRSKNKTELCESMAGEVEFNSSMSYREILEVAKNFKVAE